MKTEISFLVNGALQSVADANPTLTLLGYLRNHKLLTGTKEGCGEGDCGACTVVLGERRGNGVTYRSVNACILFVAMLEGKSVWTVEGVQGDAQTLHPVQQAFVDNNATQCGFCTPGFIMSLYAAHLNQGWEAMGDSDDLFAGNLCRCTGYGSIIAAAESVRGLPLTEADQHRIASDTAALEQIAHNQTVALAQGNRQFFSPASADDLAALYDSHPDATLVSGATDVGLWVTKQHRRLDTVIHVNRAWDLNRIDESAEKVILGAAVTYADALPVLARHVPAFHTLYRRLGAVQVRNSGTVVGNIANGSPIGDSPPALIVLGAKITLRRGSERRTLPLEDFFIAYGKQDRAPGEFVESVEIPFPEDAEAPRFYKISKRLDQDISAVCGCFNIERDGSTITRARIAFGGMAATPLRAKHVKAALEGQAWSEATIDAAMAAFAKDFTPITDMRASADYRLAMAGNLLKRYYLETTLPHHQTDLLAMEALAP
ncbi:MAG: xanthine dehydrogenase small subunit [Magnetospiraceae bacterium]